MQEVILDREKCVRGQQRDNCFKQYGVANHVSTAVFLSRLSTAGVLLLESQASVCAVNNTAAVKT